MTDFIADIFNATRTLYPEARIPERPKSHRVLYPALPPERPLYPDQPGYQQPEARIPETPMPTEGALRVWWIPQIPMRPFHVDVVDTTQALFITGVLARYDAFQFENNIKPDYSNAGGLETYRNGEWEEWSNDDGDTIDDLRRAP